MKMPGAWIGYAALPMFIILLIYFGRDKPLKERAKRLMLPWLLWCGVFTLVKLGDVAFTTSGFADEFKPWMLLAGPSLHLWFLPFCFAFLVLTKPASFNPVFVAVPISVWAIWATNTFDLAIPLAQWVFVLPAAFMGWMMRHYRNAPLVAGGALALCFMMHLAGWTQGTNQLIIAIAVIFICSHVQLPSTALSKGLSDLSLGIYLIHPLMLSVVLRTPLADNMIAGFVFVIVASILATLGLRRIAPVMVGLKS